MSPIKRLRFAALFMLSSGVFWVGCASNQTPPSDPVADQAVRNQVPDSPGEAGETSPKTGKPVASKEPKSKGKKAAKAPATASSSSFTAGDYKVNHELINVRKGPGMKFEVVGTLKNGETVKAEGIENLIWVKIGEERYVAQSFLVPAQ